MKKFLFAMAAIPAATLAVEASAQTYVNNNASVTIQNQIVQLQAQLNSGIQARTIDTSEARNLRQQIRQLNRLQRQYASGGLTSMEWNALQQRVGSINQQMQVASGGYAYGYAQPYGNAYGYNSNNGYAYGNNGYAYGSNAVTYDQYGRPITNGYSNGYYGQGGPYVPVPQQRSSGIGNVLGGMLGSAVGGGGGGVLGSILGNGGLRVGDLVTGVIGNVLGRAPSNYGSYQNNSNVYFRTDGQRVYEIDARTNQVVRIHPAR